MKKCSRCGKHRHPSSLSAIRSAVRSSRRRGTPLRVYYDKACGHWALTKKERLDWHEEAAA